MNQHAVRALGIVALTLLAGLCIYIGQPQYLEEIAIAGIALLLLT